MKASRSGKGCWYLTTVFECQLCGKADVYRERQHTKPPPATSPKRYDYIPTACGGHFL